MLHRPVEVRPPGRTSATPRRGGAASRRGVAARARRAGTRGAGCGSGTVVPVAPTSWTSRLRRAMARSRLPLPSVPASAVAARGGHGLEDRPCGGAGPARPASGAARTSEPRYGGENRSGAATSPVASPFAGGADVREGREVRRRGPALRPRRPAPGPRRRSAGQPAAGDERGGLGLVERQGELGPPIRGSCRDGAQRASGTRPGRSGRRSRRRNPAGRWSRIAVRTSRLVGFTMRWASSSTSTAGRRQRWSWSSRRGTAWWTGCPAPRGRVGARRSARAGGCGRTRPRGRRRGSPGRCPARRGSATRPAAALLVDPLREQRRLAVAGTGDQRDDRRAAAVQERPDEPRPRDDGRYTARAGAASPRAAGRPAGLATSLAGAWTGRGNGRNHGLGEAPLESRMAGARQRPSRPAPPCAARGAARLCHRPRRRGQSTDG